MFPQVSGIKYFPISTHATVTITAPGICGRNFLARFMIRSVPAKIAKAMILKSHRNCHDSIKLRVGSIPKAAGNCCSQMIRPIPRRNHCKADHGIKVRYLVSLSTPNRRIASQARTATIGKVMTPYCNEIGRRIPASDHAGPYTLCLELQNTAASTPDRAQVSNHIRGVAHHTIASDIASGTEIRATERPALKFENS